MEGVRVSNEYKTFGSLRLHEPPALILIPPHCGKLCAYSRLTCIAEASKLSGYIQPYTSCTYNSDESVFHTFASALPPKPASNVRLRMPVFSDASVMRTIRLLKSGSVVIRFIPSRLPASGTLLGSGAGFRSVRAQL